MSHIYAARVLIPHMVDNEDGYFLITVSAAGLLNMPGAFFINFLRGKNQHYRIRIN